MNEKAATCLIISAERKLSRKKCIGLFAMQLQGWPFQALPDVPFMTW